jgi:hypothetical protein
MTTKRELVGFKRLIVIFVSLMLIVGCAPVPIERVVYPSIEGTLMDNRGPLENHTIHFSYTTIDACKKQNGDLSQASKTDSNGKFIISGKRRWSLFRMAVPADGYAHYNLCIVSPTGEKRWFFASELRTPDWASPIKLVCEFERLLKVPASLDGKLSFREIGCSVDIQ